MVVHEPRLRDSENNPVFRAIIFGGGYPPLTHSKFRGQISLEKEFARCTGLRLQLCEDLLQSGLPAEEWVNGLWAAGAVRLRKSGLGCFRAALWITAFYLLLFVLNMRPDSALLFIAAASVIIGAIVPLSPTLALHAGVMPFLHDADGASMGNVSSEKLPKKERERLYAQAVARVTEILNQQSFLPKWRLREMEWEARNPR